ncbi:MAG TPA: hypothetical protein VGB24_22470 [Longimicrobium sp.]|jgi:predicted RNase H-like HicB family nuclease|uniref:hypothetical protein n=1 Tax=Longimicrobium sp. TaxID=2029185 RepID=UPI002ED9D629
MMTVDEYVALPWTVHGRMVREAPGERPYYLITIDEMDGFSVVASSRAAAEELFPIVLREHIEAWLESGHVPPIPGPSRAAIVA